MARGSWAGQEAGDQHERKLLCRYGHYLGQVHLVMCLKCADHYLEFRWSEAIDEAAVWMFVFANVDECAMEVWAGWRCAALLISLFISFRLFSFDGTRSWCFLHAWLLFLQARLRTGMLGFKGFLFIEGMSKFLSVLWSALNSHLSQVAAPTRHMCVHMCKRCIHTHVTYMMWNM